MENHFTKLRETTYFSSQPLRAYLVELHLILILYGSRIFKTSDSLIESDSFLFSNVNF
jgi:hypothetical protein